MGVGQGGAGNQRSGAKKIPGRGNIVARFVPIVWKAQQCGMGEIDANEEDWQQHSGGDGAVAADSGNFEGSKPRGGLGFHSGSTGQSFCEEGSLVYRPVGNLRLLRLERYVAEGLLILGQVLTEGVPESLGLLRGEVDALGIF